MLCRHTVLLPQHQYNRQNESKSIADWLGGKDSIDPCKGREEIDKRNQKQDLPQERNNDRRNRPGDGLEEGGGQHDKAQDRSNAEVGPQTGDTDAQHFFTGAEGKKNLAWEKQNDEPDDAGNAHREGRGLVKSGHDPFIISGAVIISQNGLDTLADAAGGHDDKGHDTGYYCIHTDGSVAAVLAQLTVVDKTDEPHGHLGDPESEAAGNDPGGKPQVRTEGFFCNLHFCVAAHDQAGAEDGGKNLSNDCGPGGSGNTPVQHSHKQCIQDNVGYGSNTGDAHAKHRFAGYPDEITENLGKSLEQTAQGYDPVIGKGVGIGSFRDTEDP